MQLGNNYLSLKNINFDNNSPKKKHNYTRVLVDFFPMLRYYHGNNEFKFDIQTHETIWRWSEDSAG